MRENALLAALAGQVKECSDRGEFGTETRLSRWPGVDVRTEKGPIGAKNTVSVGGRLRKVWSKLLA